MSKSNGDSSAKNPNPAVRVLASAFKSDPDAIRSLICNRIPCNSELANHPFVVVDASVHATYGEVFSVGALGLINGILAANNLSLVAGVFTDEDHPRLLGFCEYKPQEEPTNAPAQS